MNADNWTELTSAYGATFNPAIAPERNLLAAVVDLRNSISGNAIFSGSKTFSGNITFEGSNIFEGSNSFEGNVNFSADVTATAYKVGSNQVVGSRGAAITDLTVTATSGSLPTVTSAVTIANTATPTVVELLKYCVELETKLEALLARVRAHGLIA